jgi:hypothetical protein
MEMMARTPRRAFFLAGGSSVGVSSEHSIPEGA